jgi:hypothetical protein
MGDERTNRPGQRLAGAVRERERRGGMRPIAAEAARLAAASLARRGGGKLVRLKAAWPAVVGSELAAATWPERLGRDGALKLRVATGVALDVQHRAPLLIERINLFLGRAGVGRLVLVQGPLPLPAPAPRAAVASALPEGEEAALEDRLTAIVDPELHAALAGLGRLVLAGAKGDPS